MSTNIQLRQIVKAYGDVEVIHGVDLTIDPRLLATYEAANNNWHIRAGEYRLLLGQASDATPQSVTVTLPDAVWSAAHPYGIGEAAAGGSVESRPREASRAATAKMAMKR